jgi:small redox-active disulfide protein 2
MTDPDVTQIKVDKANIGIRGLKTVMKEMAAEYSVKADEDVKQELLKRLSKKNYIPKSARERYGFALLREFRKSLGQPFEAAPSSGLEIKVLGPGCSQCDRLEMEVMAICAEMNLPADIEHVRDVKEIGQYGVMGTPALIINGKVVCIGKVPPKNRIRGWLEGAGP